MTDRIRIVAALLLVLAGSSSVWAQDPAVARETLERKTRVGDELTIDSRDGSTVRGRLLSATADALVIEGSSGERSIDYGDIDRVRRRRNGIVLGAVIGLGAGIAYGIPVRIILESENGPGTRALLTMAALGTTLGILADYELSLNRTVYRRSPGSIAFGVAPNSGGAALRVTARW